MEEMGILSYEDLESEDFTTLGGLAMFLIGRIPKAGDIFTYKNLQFESGGHGPRTSRQTACHQTGRRAGIG